MVRKYLKHLYQSTTIGKFFITPLVNLYGYYAPLVMSEKMYARQTFKNVFNSRLNLTNPRTLNEKIIWLRLNEKTEIKTKCADKYSVRDYVDSKIGAKYLIPIIHQTSNPKEIVPDIFPDYPFIIKTNHGCGGHIIVKNRSEMDWKDVRKVLTKSLKKNFYYKSKEWQYKNIIPRILVEKLLLENNNPPKDYKFNCFNGKVNTVEVHYDRHIQYKKNIYYPNWNEIDCRWGAPRGRDIDKPKNLEKMINLAEELSKKFKYVRVDLYNVNDNIYFGEITFSPAGGYCPFVPQKWDRIFGDRLNI